MRSSTTADQVAHTTEVERENAVGVRSTARRPSRATSNRFFESGTGRRCLTSSTSGPFDDVKANADAILAAVRTGSMPCDTPWSTEKVDLLQRWVDSSTPR